MFFPILLHRDYGMWGFVAFAIPNILGAAAMGFVLTRQQSKGLVQTHKPMIVTFSFVTIAFHFFFLVWLTESRIFTHDGDATGLTRLAPTLAALLPVLAISTWFLLHPRSRRHHRLIAAATWILSFLAIGLSPAYEARLDHLPSSTFGLIGLAPISVFGFLLCPYLDATFHRVRIATGRRSGRAAFAIGFGFFFAVMILATLIYRGALIHMIHPEASFRHVHIFQFTPLIFHLLLQVTFTVFVHALMLRRLGIPAIALLLPPVVGLVAGLAAKQFDTFPMFAMTTGELTYRIFLSAYGLIFPAYVYLCMIPTRDRHSGLAGPSGRRKRNTWLGVVAIAAPFFWMGFIERRELFLIPGLAFILLARLTLPGGWKLPKRATQEPRGGGVPPPIAGGT